MNEYPYNTKVRGRRRLVNLQMRADRLAEEKDQMEQQSNLWFDLVCGLISENKDPGLLRRALDAVELQQESA